LVEPLHRASRGPPPPGIRGRIKSDPSLNVEQLRRHPGIAERGPGVQTGRMMTASLISALLAVAPAAAIAPPAASEPEVWKLAAKVNTIPAYEVYLDRFPEGPHLGAAVEAYHRLGGPIFTVAPPPVVTTVPPPPDPCDDLLLAQDMSRGDSPEARAFIDARRSNRPAGFRAYLAGYPSGVCRARATRILEARKAGALRFKRVPGLGPLAPHRLGALDLTADDYPAPALRAEETGRVVAEWEVAEDGVVEGCRVVESSGSPALDETSCRLITARLRYDPARDRAGAVIRSADRMSIGWTLPD